MKAKDIIEHLQSIDGETEVYVSDGMGNVDEIYDIQANVIMGGWHVKEVLDNMRPN